MWHWACNVFGMYKSNGEDNDDDDDNAFQLMSVVMVMMVLMSQITKLTIHIHIIKWVLHLYFFSFYFSLSIDGKFHFFQYPSSCLPLLSVLLPLSLTVKKIWSQLNFIGGIKMRVKKTEKWVF